jgi:hypothetical protein
MKGNWVEVFLLDTLFILYFSLSMIMLELLSVALALPRGVCAAFVFVVVFYEQNRTEQAMVFLFLGEFIDVELRTLWWWWWLWVWDD